MNTILKRAAHLSRSASGIGLVILLVWHVSSLSPDSHSRLHRVEMSGLRFQPRNLRIAQGDTVTWVNDDIVPHTVTFTDSGWDSGEMPPGGEFRWVATGTGTMEYVCRFHPAMAGTLRLPRSRGR